MLRLSQTTMVCELFAIVASFARDLEPVEARFRRRLRELTDRCDTAAGRLRAFRSMHGLQRDAHPQMPG